VTRITERRTPPGTNRLRLAYPLPARLPAALPSAPRVNGEAQIAWNDGWHDAIRKDGAWYHKYAYSEGTTFHDQPDNVTNARNLTQNPTGVD